MVYPALLPLLPLIRTPRLPVVDWTDTPRRFKWTRPFRWKTKSGSCACATTFQTCCTLVQALRLCTDRAAQSVCRGIAVLFLDHGNRRRPLFTPGKASVPIVQEAGCAPGLVWTGAENLAPAPGFDPRTVQPVANRYTDYGTRPTPVSLIYRKIFA